MSFEVKVGIDLKFEIEEMNLLKESIQFDSLTFYLFCWFIIYFSKISLLFAFFL